MGFLSSVFGLGSTKTSVQVGGRMEAAHADR